jgi:hypothetical protein
MAGRAGESTFPWEVSDETWESGAMEHGEFEFEIELGVAKEPSGKTVESNIFAGGAKCSRPSGYHGSDKDHVVKILLSGVLTNLM